MTATDPSTNLRQRVVLAHSDPVYTAQASRQFRRLGWEVFVARSGAAARRLAQQLNPTAVVLGTELTDESGWLICDKLTSEWPALRVILVATDADAAQTAFAEFVGAAVLVKHEDGAAALVHEVLGAALSATG
jgi:DNA-binding response OmpR family regulator